MNQLEQEITNSLRWSGVGALCQPPPPQIFFMTVVGYSPIVLMDTAQFTYFLEKHYL